MQNDNSTNLKSDVSNISLVYKYVSIKTQPNHESKLQFFISQVFFTFVPIHPKSELRLQQFCEMNRSIPKRVFGDIYSLNRESRSDKRWKYILFSCRF